eukprot:c52669_g1_i1.p1 GENE.c52669_g1_i1~~c52669_g1_i1.p1  ORF type:complete len:372 (+),score=58.45 c52669_g1_i1:1-1116(+)
MGTTLGVRQPPALEAMGRGSLAASTSGARPNSKFKAAGHAAIASSGPASPPDRPPRQWCTKSTRFYYVVFFVMTAVLVLTIVSLHTPWFTETETDRERKFTLEVAETSVDLGSTSSVRYSKNVYPHLYDFFAVLRILVVNSIFFQSIALFLLAYDLYSDVMHSDPLRLRSALKLKVIFGVLTFLLFALSVITFALFLGKGPQARKRDCYLGFGLPSSATSTSSCGSIYSFSDTYSTPSRRLAAGFIVTVVCVGVRFLFGLIMFIVGTSLTAAEAQRKAAADQGANRIQMQMEFQRAQAEAQREALRAKQQEQIRQQKAKDEVDWSNNNDASDEARSEDSGKGASNMFLKVKGKPQQRGRGGAQGNVFIKRK